jgi:hypothetical protein
MEKYHIYFFIVYFIILLFILLTTLKIINHENKNKVFTIIDFIFKISFGFFLIFFFITNKLDKLGIYDRLLFVLAGFVLIASINYIEMINICSNKYQNKYQNKLLEEMYIPYNKIK